MSQIEDLDRQIKAKQAELDQLHNQRSRVISDCQHDWGETEYVPDYQEAYTIPGDPPGTMGVDWRGPTHVPAKTTPKWQRKCKKCGYVETTTRTTEKVSHTPKF